MSNLISNCCSAPMPDHAESDLCPQCKEHCSAIDLEKCCEICGEIECECHINEAGWKG